MTTENIAIPLYLQIKDEIKALINTGKLKEGDKIPSVNDITQKYGVSPITAVRVFKELSRENYASPEKGKGYFVSLRQEKNSRRKLHGVIGCMIRPYRPTTAYDNYFNEINAGIQKECMKRNFDTLYPGFCFDLNNHNLSPQALTKLEQAILPVAERVDGLILDERIPDIVLEKIVGKLKIPYVLVFRQSNNPNIKSLVPAFSDGTKKAMELAVKSGYKNFILCNHYVLHPTINSAMDSAKRSLSDFEKRDTQLRSIPIENCFAKDFDIMGQIMSAYDKFKASKRKTLIFCVTDGIARYVCDEMEKRGLSLGSDLGLLGVGGFNYTTMKKPEIATVDTKPFELGQLAAEWIFQEINQQTEAVNEIVPTFELKLGDTF
ncbi:MAG: GntR family transcriptional regulator [Lentisphaerota bacterium]